MHWKLGTREISLFISGTIFYYIRSLYIKFPLYIVLITVILEGDHGCSTFLKEFLDIHREIFHFPYRKKKTVAEARRLEYIQKELAKIESLLTNDVSILRDKIETTSRDFLDAQYVIFFFISICFFFSGGGERRGD